MHSGHSQRAVNSSTAADTCPCPLPSPLQVETMLQHAEQSERLHGKVRWAEVAAQLPGRTDENVKTVYERLRKSPVRCLAGTRRLLLTCCSPAWLCSTMPGCT